MKRSLITTLVIGVAVTIVVGALHATKAIAGFETAIAQLVSDYARATRVVGRKMALHFCPGDSCRCRLAQPEEPAAAAKLPVVRFFTGRVACPFVGLLPLPDFLPACSLHFCGCTSSGRRGGLDRFFAERPLVFSAGHIFANRLSKKEFHRVSNGAFDGQAQVYRSERRGLRHCQSTWIDEFI